VRLTPDGQLLVCSVYLFAVEAKDEGPEADLYEPLVDATESEPVSKLAKLKDEVITVLK
jgi:hypothetical protein